MRKRECHINVRTSENEKKLIERNAKKCGLSISEFLRKLANGYTPKEQPPLEYGKLISVLSEIYAEMKVHYSSETERKILQAMLAIQRGVILPERSKDGDNKNMAGEG